LGFNIIVNVWLKMRDTMIRVEEELLENVLLMMKELNYSKSKLLGYIESEYSM
jgi:hypothetical protein